MPTTPLVGDFGLCESAVARAGWAAVRAMALQSRHGLLFLSYKWTRAGSWMSTNGRIGGFRFGLAVSSALKTRHAGDSLCLLLASLRRWWMPSDDKFDPSFCGLCITSHLRLAACRNYLIWTFRTGKTCFMLLLWYGVDAFKVGFGPSEPSAMNGSTTKYNNFCDIFVI